MFIVVNMPLGLDLVVTVDEETLLTDVLELFTLVDFTVVDVVLGSGDVLVLVVCFEVVISVGVGVVAIVVVDDNVEDFTCVVA